MHIRKYFLLWVIELGGSQLNPALAGTKLDDKAQNWAPVFHMHAHAQRDREIRVLVCVPIKETNRQKRICMCLCTCMYTCI